MIFNEISLFPESLVSVLSYYTSWWVHMFWNPPIHQRCDDIRTQATLIQEWIVENNPLMFHCLRLLFIYRVSMKSPDPEGWSRCSLCLECPEAALELARHLWSSSTGWFRLTELKLFLTFQCRYSGQVVASCSFSTCFSSRHTVENHNLKHLSCWVQPMAMIYKERMCPSERRERGHQRERKYHPPLRCLIRVALSTISQCHSRLRWLNASPCLWHGQNNSWD